MGRAVGPVPVQEGPERGAGDRDAGVGHGLDQPLDVELTGERQAEPVEGLELRLELASGRPGSRGRGQVAVRLPRVVAPEPAADERSQTRGVASLPSEPAVAVRFLVLSQWPLSKLVLERRQLEEAAL